MNFLLLLSVLCSTSIDDYIISVGDTLLITAYGNVSLSYQQAVTSNGDIFIQYVPSLSPKETPFTAWEVLEVVNVAGMNVRAATEVVEKRFKKYFKDIKVSLLVTSFRNRVYITGEVVNPETYPFLPGRSIREYIEDAGGLSLSADLSLLRVTKYDSIIEATAESTVEENWSIYIPSAYVYIRGMVVEPGVRSYNPNLSGVDYIGVAGGPSERGDMKRAYILTKEGKKLPITDCPKMYSTVVVPEIGLKWWQDYVTVASAIVTLLVTWLTLTK